MPKEKFEEYRPSEASLRIISQANQIIANYASQGLDLSLRQLYYQFVSKNYITNSDQSYSRMGDIISKARLAGMLDWDAIKDRGRTSSIPSHWSGPAQILRAVAQQFHVDLWEGQENHVEVMVEKDALSGVLEPVCNRLDVHFTANKGYSSSSAMYEIGKRLRDAHLSGMSYGNYEDMVQDLYFNWGANERIVDDFKDNPNDENPYEESSWRHKSFEQDREAFKNLIIKPEVYSGYLYPEDFEDNEGIVLWDKFIPLVREYLLPPPGGKRLHVIYLGDHDPSGIDMTRDVKDRLELLSRCPVNVHRIALNMPQVRQYTPPENPAKLTDSRATDYIKKFGSKSWELDALEPALLASLVSDQILDLRDDTKYEAALAKQNAWKEDLNKIAQDFDLASATNAETQESDDV